MERRARALDTDPLGAASCGRPPPEGVARLRIRDPMGRSLFLDEYQMNGALRSAIVLVFDMKALPDGPTSSPYDP